MTANIQKLLYIEAKSQQKLDRQIQSLAMARTNSSFIAATVGLLLTGYGALFQAQILTVQRVHEQQIFLAIIFLSLSLLLTIKSVLTFWKANPSLEGLATFYNQGMSHERMLKKVIASLIDAYKFNSIQLQNTQKLLRYAIMLLIAALGFIVISVLIPEAYVL